MKLEKQRRFIAAVIAAVMAAALTAVMTGVMTAAMTVSPRFIGVPRFMGEGPVLTFCCETPSDLRGASSSAQLMSRKRPRLLFFWCMANTEHT